MSRPRRKGKGEPRAGKASAYSQRKLDGGHPSTKWGTAAKHGSTSYHYSPHPAVNLVGACVTEAIARAGIVARAASRRWGSLSPAERADIVAEAKELREWSDPSCGLPWQLGWCVDVLQATARVEIDGAAVRRAILAELDAVDWQALAALVALQRPSHQAAKARRVDVVDAAGAASGIDWGEAGPSRIDQY